MLEGFLVMSRWYNVPVKVLLFLEIVFAGNLCTFVLLGLHSAPDSFEAVYISLTDNPLWLYWWDYHRMNFYNSARPLRYCYYHHRIQQNFPAILLSSKRDLAKLSSNMRKKNTSSKYKKRLLSDDYYHHLIIIPS